MLQFATHEIGRFHEVFKQFVSSSEKAVDF
jgi:hypothetical protein